MENVPQQVLPLSRTSRQLVTEYLTSKGEDLSTVQWKYFDGDFNSSKERGFVFQNKGRIAGFIGLIPFTVKIGSCRIDAAWSCDWYKDDDIPGPFGILLIKETVRHYRYIYSLGGNQNSKHVLTRLAQNTIPDAGVVLYRPLRLGGILKPAARKLRCSLLEASGILNSFPLVVTRNPESGLAILPGISPAAAPALEVPAGLDPVPSYDLKYVEWQIGRCPSLLSQTCIATPAVPDIALFCWRSIESEDFWRLAIVSRTGIYDGLDRILLAALQHIYRQKGSLVSILISRHEADLHRRLKRRGFLPLARRPLYVLTSESNGPAAELKRLSFLDTDWAYRIPYLPSESRRR
jgi:hypothetical protein